MGNPRNATPSRSAIDFNSQAPPLAVTNPDRAAAAERGEALPDPEYPKHLALPVEDGPGGPGNRETAVAENAADERSLRAQGFMTHHEADKVEAKGKAASAPRAPKPAPAKKPRNPQPKTPAVDEPVS